MKTVVITGEARSGTSVTCGLVNCLGVPVMTSIPRERQLKANPKGMFEHSGFIMLNRISRELGPLATVEKIKEFQDKYGDQIKSLMDRHGKDREIWGFKNLGICGIEIFLPFIRNPHIIYVTRSPADHAKAYVAFHKFSEGNDIDQWESLKRLSRSNYSLALSMKRIECPKHMLTFEDVRSRPWFEAQRLARFLGITPTKEMQDQVMKFVDKRIKTWEEKDGKFQFVPAR